MSDGEILAGEPLRAVLVAAAVLIAATLPAAAQDATWNLNGTGDFNTNGNWTPSSQPSGTAFFGVSNQNAVTFSNRVTTIGGWTFNAGASAYTFTTSSLTFPFPALTFIGAGVVINGGSATIINNNSFGSVNFNNASTAGSAAITNGATVNFNNTSTAGSAAITNNAGSVNFNDASTAGSAAITNGATITNAVGVIFNNTSTAGSATITNNGFLVFNNASTASSAAITNNNTVEFFGTSTAASATITNTGAVLFFNTSTAGSAAITSTGFGGVEFLDTSTAGSAAITSTGSGAVQFFNASTAGSATITSTGSGAVRFFNTSTAGNAAITNSGTGFVDFSNSTGPNNDHKLSAGSIAGGGSFILGANQLTVGGNNLSTVVSGVIEDSGAGGALVKIGTGALTLTGTNTYAGGTTVNGGTLQIGNGGTTGSIVGNVIDNATLAFNRSDTLTFGGAISGSGALQQIGPGTLVLTGTKTYTGGTTVNGGTIEVDGSIATSSLTTVNGGAALTGTGTVSATQINSGGTLAPGNAANPTGTLNIAGNLAFASGAIYMVQISPTAASMANVSGTATLNGTLEAVFAPGAPGTYLTRRYDVLHAAAVNGTFAAVTGINTPIGLFNLVYTATDVFLDFIASIGGDGTPLNGNQQAVASSINNVLNSGGALPPGFVPLFTLGGTSLQTELSHLDGEAAADAQKGSFALMTEFLSLMLDPFVDGRGGSSGSGGATPFAPERAASFPPDIALAYKRHPQSPSAAKHRAALDGMGRGLRRLQQDQRRSDRRQQHRHRPRFRLCRRHGLSLLAQLARRLLARRRRHQLGLGAGARRRAQRRLLRRPLRQDPLRPLVRGRRARRRRSVVQHRPHRGVRRSAHRAFQRPERRRPGRGRLSLCGGADDRGDAVCGLAGAKLPHPAHSETDVTAGGFGLTYNDMSASDTRSELGARFDDLTVLGAMPLVLRARAAWAHDAVSNPALGAVFQALPGAGFIVNGAAPPKNSALASAGAELRMTKTWSLAAKFDGEFAARAQTYAGTGTLRYQW